MIRFRTQVTLVMTLLVVMTSVALCVALISASTNMMQRQMAIMGSSAIRVVAAQLEQKQRILQRSMPGMRPGENHPPLTNDTPQNSVPDLNMSPTDLRQVPITENTQPVQRERMPSQPNDTRLETPFDTDLREMGEIIHATRIALVTGGKIQKMVDVRPQKAKELSGALVQEMWQEMSAQQRRHPVKRDTGAYVLLMTPVENVFQASEMSGLLVELPQTLYWHLLVASALELTVISLTVIVFAVLAAWIISRNIAKPISNLAVTAGTYGEGDLDISAPVAGPAETQELGMAFNSMATAMKEHIRNLQEETRRREQLESELRVAAALQRSLLPKPGIQQYGPVEVYGWSEASEEVGGDFYDYCFVGPERLLFVIGDATGKGIPAALLAAKCLSVLHALMEEYADPAELLQRANGLVAKQFKEDGHFVTVFLGIADFSTKGICYSRAGHNPPLLTDSSSGQVKALSDQGGLPLGVTAQGTFEQSVISIQNGGTLLLYTDGITEASDGETNFYGSARLSALLKETENLPLPDLCNHVINDVKSFRNNRTLEDDCTLLLLRFRVD